jgi:hypothetical protein
MWQFREPPEEWDPSYRLLTYEEAGRSADRPPSTIRRWVSEDRLTVLAWMGRSALVLEADVLRVDGEMRRDRRP